VKDSTPAFYIGDLVEYKGVIYKISKFFEKDGRKWAVLNLETLALPVIKEAREVMSVMSRYSRSGQISNTVHRDGETSYSVFISLDDLKVAHLDFSPESLELLRKYVQEKLLASGVIDEYHANPVNPDSVAAHIVADAWRQHDRHYYADMGIEQAIKYPPSAINEKRFSLRAFVKEVQS